MSGLRKFHKEWALDGPEKCLCVGDSARLGAFWIKISRAVHTWYMDFHVMEIQIPTGGPISAKRRKLKSTLIIRGRGLFLRVVVQTDISSNWRILGLNWRSKTDFHLNLLGHFYGFPISKTYFNASGREKFPLDR